MGEKDLTHFDEAGRSRMVDVSEKAITARRAVARGSITMAPETLKEAASRRSKKGDAIAVAELAGIMGAKRTADLIPLCHPLPLSGVNLTITEDTAQSRLIVEAEARTAGQTGVEMEAMTAVSVACLTLYDMLKSIDRSMTIGEIALWEKEGGKSGHWRREAQDG